MYSFFTIVTLAFASLIAAQTPIIPLSACKDLIGGGCVDGTAQCCFTDQDSSSAFVLCVFNVFEQDTCSPGSCSSDPDEGTVNCNYGKGSN